jgi:hypothetical protein
LSSIKRIDRTWDKAPSLGDPQFGRTHNEMLELIRFADSIIMDLDFEIERLLPYAADPDDDIRSSDTVERFAEWKEKMNLLLERLRK